VNLSDHLPIMAVCLCKQSTTPATFKTDNSAVTLHLRWDHALLTRYYDHTRLFLQPVFQELCALETAHFCNTDDINERVDAPYDNVVNALRSAADLFIPECKKNFYKFWWNAELDVLK